jgi:hypothetical protein
VKYKTRKLVFYAAKWGMKEGQELRCPRIHGFQELRGTGLLTRKDSIYKENYPVLSKGSQDDYLRLYGQEK